MNYEKIGKYIQQKRKEKNMTQKQLSEKLGVTDKAVSKWERGLGCPDVSILELLAQELDTSIIEILKGRTIENEIIKIKETNDYLKDTIKYTKNQTKRIVNKIIIFITITISTILLILNVENIISLNKKYEYDFDNQTVKEMKNQKKQLENNIEKIEKNQGKLTNIQYEEIIKNLKYIKEKIEDLRILKYENKKSLSMNEIYLIDDDIIIDLHGIKILNELQEFEKEEQLLKDNITAKIYLNTNIHNQIEKTYKYKMINIPNNLEEIYDTYNDPINMRIMYTKSTISTYVYITDKIIEVGEINEKNNRNY